MYVDICSTHLHLGWLRSCQSIYGCVAVCRDYQALLGLRTVTKMMSLFLETDSGHIDPGEEGQGGEGKVVTKQVLSLKTYSQVSVPFVGVFLVRPKFASSIWGLGRLALGRLNASPAPHSLQQARMNEQYLPSQCRPC